MPENNKILESMNHIVNLCSQYDSFCVEEIDILKFQKKLLSEVCLLEKQLRADISIKEKSIALKRIPFLQVFQKESPHVLALGVVTGNGAMKIKDIIKILQKQNQEADAFVCHGDFTKDVDRVVCFEE